MSHLVALLPSSKLPFRRAYRDKTGGVTKVLRFDIGEKPLELSDEEFLVVRPAIGITLVLCEPSPNWSNRYDVNWDATNDIRIELHGSAMEPEARTIDAGLGGTNSVYTNPDGGSVATEVMAEAVTQIAEFFPAPLPAPAEPKVVPHVKPRVMKREDIEPLMDAGIDPELASELYESSGSYPWVLDPEQLANKIGRGFDLTTFKGVGPGRSKQIKIALGMLE